MKLTPEQLEKLSPARRALLEKMLAERSSAKRAAVAPADIPRRAGSGPVPLSFAQQRLWFIHQLDPRSPAYNMPAGIRLRGPLDPRSLRRALAEIVRRHEALRTVFAASGDGEPVQVVLPPAPARLPVVELAGLAPPDRERETRRLGDAESAHPFDLGRGPLLRSALLVLDAADHAVLFTMHHIVSDGWSMGVLVREVSELYAAFAAGLASPLPELPVQYADFAVWQREHLSGRRLEEQLEFWNERLAGAPALLELPVDRPRAPVEDPAGTRLAFTFSPELSAAVLALARGEGATLFMALLAGLQLTLARWSGQDDVVVGSPIAGRTRVELEGLIGFFVNTLVLRTGLSGDPTARELLARVRRGVLEAQSNQEFPFERLVEEIQPERTLAHSPLFQVLLSLQNVDSGSLQLGAGLELEPISSTLDTAKFDLSWTMEEVDGVVAGGVSYRRSLWDGATVQRMVDHFRAVLAGMAAYPDRPVSRIELLTAAERGQVLRLWNDTAAGYPVRGGLRALVEAQAARTPAAVAVAFGAQALTYAELDRRADALAGHLLALGAGTDARVGLCVERSLEMAVGVLGILKAGAACVPIDPAYPEERVAFMLEDAAAAVLLTQERLVGRLPAAGAEVVVLDGEGENDASDGEGRQHGDAPPPERGRVASLSEPGGGLPADPDALAYVIYTSGSTGRPKGVAMPQRPLLNLLSWQLREWDGAAAARTLQFASLSFDVSFQEILSTWASGGTLLLVPEEVRTDMPRLARFLAGARVERIFLPFVALQHLAEAAEAEGIVPGSLREVVTAGEQLRVTEPIRRWLGRMPGCALVNQYGPTETHVATSLALPGAADGWPLLPGIGGPIANTQCYVLDGELRPAPVGIPGELYLGGDGVARGYLGRPELTAARFVPDPHGPRPGGRLYRPGDRARWLAGGELEFLGRTDQQVKVRGFRIEPGEVEAALEAHPAVGEAVVAVREDAPGERRLAAYLVAAPGAAVPGGTELRAFLAARLPEYMVPAAFVALGSLPLTLSGKIDRRALPAPGASAAEAEYVAPRTPTEAALAGIYAAVLRREPVGAHDGFFVLGGHSLLATRVVSRVRDALGVELPLRTLFQAPTVAALAARVDDLLGERAGPERETERVRPRGTGGPVPLSFAQQRLWFIDRMEPGSSAYNLPSALRLRGPLDAAVLRRTLAGVVRRHESLRTVFADAADGPVQVVLPFAGAALPAADLSALPGEARERELLRLAAEEARRPFDLARGPLLRSLLVRLGGEDHAVLFTMHHVVGDGWSNGVLVGEVSALYAALAGGLASPLPELPVQYPDYAVWQREWLSGERLEAQLGWWRERMEGAPPVLELPADRPRPAVPDPRGATLGFALPAELAAGLRELAVREGTTLFAVLLAGWQAVLARWSGQDDVVVGTPVAGRTRTELEGLIGFFVNTLVLRVDLGGDPSLRELVARVGEATLGAQAHQDLPFERLVEELSPERSLRHTPLFQVLFTLQNADEGELRLGAVEMEPLGPAEAAAKFDLSLVLAERGGQVAGALQYRAGLWEEATVRRMADHFRAALGALAADPDRRLSAVELLGEDERRLLVEAWSRSGAEAAPAGRCVHELFAEQAERTPHAAALVAGGETMTYAELHRRAEALARRLAARGVGPDARVGIFVERGPEMVVGLLGVLMAGGAYVPLDPRYPAARLAYMLADAGVRLLLTQEPLRDRLPEFEGEVIVLDAEHPGAEDAGALSRSPSPDSLAYVIYTSGSTGLPKGTEVPHRAIPGFFRGADYARWDERTVVLQHSSVSWDTLTLELWPALLTGGTCVLYPGRTPEPAALGEQVRAHGVNTLWLTAAYFNLVVDTAPEALEGVEQLLVGGETVSAPHVRRALELYPGLRLVNGYGPSETTVFAACYPVPAGFQGSSLPIGRPVGDRRVYLLDRHFGPAPLGAAGELCIGGPGVARGYLGRPGLTAERFIPDPFAGEGGARLYRSGDRARWRADGRLEFMGRVDFQVKIRGFRVEPGEVEAVLASHPAVREAAVTVHERAPGDRRLAGYVTAAEGAPPTPAELRAWLGERMPEHMVPAAVAVLDALPLTPHGKLDRRALPAPDAADDGEAYTAPRTPAEETLAGIWAEVLGAERVGVHADFFALGGHSLLATRVTSRIRESFGVELPVRALFEAPTVAALAPRVEAALRAGSGAAEPAPPIVPVPRDPLRALPLSFAQQRLWLIDRMEPGSAAYNIPTPLRLRGALDVRALRRALAEIVRRHEALRTVFAEADGEPVQVVRPAGPVALPVVELGGLPAAARERELRRLAGAEGGRPFDLRRGPLLRAALLRVDDAEWALLLNVHHIVSDGWSTGILVGEFSALYGAFARGEPSPLPEPRVQYADFAAWQRAWLSGERLEAQLAFWREKLKDAPPALDLPTDAPRLAVPGARGATRGFALTAEASAAVRGLCRREGVTPFMALLAAWQLLLACYAATEDVSVGTAIAGRNRVELEGLVGFFVNTLVLRTVLGGRPTVREALRRVREATLGAFAHQDVPFERLVEELAPERSLRQAPLFQVMFSFQNMDAGALELGALELAPLAWSGEAAKFDLSLTAREDGDRFGGFVTFRTDLFAPATVERMLEHFATLAAAMAEDPERPIFALPLMDAAERARVLEAAHGPTRAYPRYLSVHALFERQAARTPHAVAAVFDGGSWSYAELERRAGTLAHALLRRRLAPETRIGVFLERGPEWLAALLAVLKAGAVYVPLDPSHPAERVRWVLEDSGASLLLTAGGLRGRVPEFGGEIVVVDGETPLPPAPSPARGEGEHDTSEGGDRQHGDFPLPERGRVASLSEPGGGPPAAASPVSADPDTLAYVIYTSGSTGTPKGVLTTHGGAANYLAFLAEEYGLGEGDTVLQVATPTFDASIRETLGPLTVGARLVLSPAGETADPRRVLERMRDHGVTAILAVVPSVLRPILAEAEQSAGVAGSLRLLLASGEPLPVADVRRAHAVFGSGLRVVNQWGATECTMSSTLHTVADEEAWPIAPAGVPIRNTRVFVLDAELEPTPLGVPGEAYIATPGLARGYGGRPDLTAEKFVPDPFSGDTGARMYRVGDRVRRRGDGVLEFLGRVDQQVKVQGVRVEPGEIEAVLRAHPSVAAAAVVAREARPGEARLVAYVVAADGPDATGPTPAELRAYLADRLPPYLVPTAWVGLDALPLLPSGKLDRRALPDPEESAAETEYVAPRTPTEEILAGIWAEVLGVERVGASDDFFALGGHSLLGARMVARVRGALGVELPLRALFEAPTLSGAAARVEAALREGAGGDAPPLVPTPRDGRPLPLSFAQQRLWLLHRLAPASAAYNMPHPLRLEGALDVRALRRSLDLLAARHEPLRTVFTEAGGEPAQDVRPPSPVALPVVDVSRLPAEARGRETRRLAAAESLRSFDLARGPLMRALLVRAGGEEHGLLFTLHHAVADGWSLGVLTREVSQAYPALAGGRAPSLPPLPVQYADYALWQRAWLSGEVLERHLDWWRGQLAGAPPLLDLPTDRPRPPVMGEAAASVAFDLSAELTDALRALARREGATLFMTLLAGWQALLARWSGQDDVSVGVPVAGRSRVELEGLIGMFVNTLVLRSGVRPDAGFRALLARVREATLGAYAHQEVPFEKLVEELEVERSRRHTPLFQVSFALQNMELGEPALGGLRLSPLGGSEEAAKFDLRLTMTETDGRVRGILSFRSELFDAATAARMAGGLRLLLEAAAADPERPLARLPLMSEAERRRALEAGESAAPAPATVAVPEAFAARAALAPDAPAVAAGASVMTYGELDRWSNRLARHLRGLGVGPETRVAVGLERSPELVLALLAVLRAGGAYVPLDPAQPPERLAGMLGDAGARLVLTTAALADRFPRGPAELLPLDAAHERIAAESDAPLEGAILPDTLAYVIFTSGSTGRPRGVAVTHAALASHMAWMQREFPLAPHDRVLQKTPVGFDASVWEFWAPLLAGAGLALAAPGAHRDPAALLRAVEEERASVLQLVPSMLAAMLEHGGLERCTSLRTLFCGGEALSADAAARARAVLPGARVVNLYGPTECTIDATSHVVVGGGGAGGTVPIGRPVDGVAAFVLDPEAEPVPPGVAGELYLGGAQLARGYLGRPEWTAGRFVPDGLSGAAGARLYRTGDRARWLPTGELEFLGRVDEQVKVRGFRIEPGEVEAALERHPGVARAAVAARDDAPGGPRLVGYVVPSAGAAPDAAELRAHLRGLLPEPMIPAAFAVLETLPLTPSGKTDRRALPPPDASAADAEPVAPRGVVEELLAEMWREVLRLDVVGVFDDFFALGGHSLLATRVIARIREEMGEDVPLRVMFDTPTIAGMAAYLQERLMEDEEFAGLTSPDPESE